MGLIRKKKFLALRVDVRLFFFHKIFHILDVFMHVCFLAYGILSHGSNRVKSHIIGVAITTIHI